MEAGSDEPDPSVLPRRVQLSAVRRLVTITNDMDCQSVDRRRALLHVVTYILYLKNPLGDVKQYDLLAPSMDSLRGINDYHWQELRKRHDDLLQSVAGLRPPEWAEGPSPFVAAYANDPLATLSSYYLVWHIRFAGRLFQREAISQSAFKQILEWSKALLPLARSLDRERARHPDDKHKRPLELFIKCALVAEASRRWQLKTESALFSCILELALLWKEGQVEREKRGRGVRGT